jgi:hypothetical protein
VFEKNKKYEITFDIYLASEQALLERIVEENCRALYSINLNINTVSLINKKKTPHRVEDTKFIFLCLFSPKIGC